MERLLDRVAALESAMHQMQERQEAAEGRAAAMQRERDAAARDRNRWRGLAAVLALLVVVGLATQSGHAQLTIDQRVAVLENKLQHLRTTGTAMIISGANLFIHNGTGATASVNGLGSLILGFNEARPLNVDGTNPNLRNGSHNLVLGSRNNYRSYGGIVAGELNEISGGFASVLGGFGNTASGSEACVSGGYANKATGYAASVSGGVSNTASAGHASVSGGGFNTASSLYASVNGGVANTASAPYASVGGGYHNLANGSASSVSGGEQNLASGYAASVSGGLHRSAPGDYDWAAGGLYQSQ